MSHYEQLLEMTARWEEAMRKCYAARRAAIIARENPPCLEFEEDCIVCQSNKMIDEWEAELL